MAPLHEPLSRLAGWAPGGLRVVVVLAAIVIVFAMDGDDSEPGEPGTTTESVAPPGPEGDPTIECR